MQQATSGNGHRGVAGATLQPSAAATFAAIWDSLAELLGTAATAAVVRRAAHQGAVECRELAEVVVVREDLDYRYSLPDSWRLGPGEPGLRVLATELARLLTELTGTIAVRRLEQLPEVQRRGLVLGAEQGS